MSLENVDLAAEDGGADVLALDEALTALQKHDPRAAQIVQLRYFVGLTVEDTAAALELSERTVRREWNYARLWLFERMTGEEPDDGAGAAQE